MEALRGEIEKFLVISYGYGNGDVSGNGSGFGFGSGSGDGSGYGSGSGYGLGDGSGNGSGNGSGSGDGNGYGDVSGNVYGDGSGYGSGSGDGDGIKDYNGQTVYMIDCMATIIYSVRGNYAKGSIIRGDLTLSPCYIAKVDNSFAHGDTLHKAYADAWAKAMEDISKDERLDKFLQAHSDRSAKYPAEDLFWWHGFLTGSCRLGREQFVREHNIDMSKDEYTLDEFVQLTEKEYGCEVIKQLKAKYYAKED